MNVCSCVHPHMHRASACVCDITHSNPSLNPLILPLEAQLSVNKGRERKGVAEWIIFPLLLNPGEISESFTQHNSFKM